MSASNLQIFLLPALLACTFLACSRESDRRDDAGVKPDTSLAARHFARADSFAEALPPRYDSASVYFEMASVQYEKKGDWEGYVRSVNRLSESAWRSARLDEALHHANRALEVGRGQLGEQHPGVIGSSHSLGAIFFFKGDYDQAITYWSQGLRLQQLLLDAQHPDVTLDDVAKTYNNLGNAYARKGDYDQALSAHNKALSFFQETLGEEHFITGNTYVNLGADYLYKGDFDQAVNFLNRALSIFLETKGEHHPLVASTYNNLGVAYDEKGDYERAIASLQKALATKIAVWRGEQHPDVAYSYNSLGVTFRHKGQPDHALFLLNKALSIWQETLGASHPLVGFVYNNIGEVYLDKGDLDQAHIFLGQALSVKRAVLGDIHPDVAFSYNEIGNVYARKGSYDRAARYYQHAILANVPGFTAADPYALPPLDSTLSEPVLLSSLEGKAQALARHYTARTSSLRDLEAASSTYQHAARLIDRMRTGYKAEGSKLILAEKAHDVYEQGIQTTLRLHRLSGDPAYQDAAFDFAEKSRAGMLLNAIAEAQAERFAGIPDTLLERGRQLRLDLSSYESMLAEELAKGKAADLEKVRLWRSKLFALRQAYEAYIHTLQSYPEYYKLTYGTETASVGEIQGRMISDSSAVVEYFVGKDSLYIFVITEDGLRVTPTPKDTSFVSQLSLLRERINAWDPLSWDPFFGYVDHVYVTLAHRLYQMLLDPVEPQLAGKKYLIIIPDEELAYVPFEALLTEEVSPYEGPKTYSELPYVITKYAVAYSYSATLLLDIMEQDERRAMPLRDYIGFAPVYFDKPAVDRSSRWKTAFLGSPAAANGHPGKNATLEPLKESDDEVSGILEAFNAPRPLLQRLFSWIPFMGSGSQIYLEEAASEDRVKAEDLTEYRYVHFSTHALVRVDSISGLLAGLVLPVHSASTREDGFLYAGEVYALKLNADLVVLSACRTGLGEVARGEGIIGLTRGFLYAGASKVIVTLWFVDDVYSKDLMIDFYRRIIRGTSDVAALRGAKLRQIDEGKPPVAWCWFTLIGT